MPQPEALFKKKLCRLYATAFSQGWYQYNQTQLKRGVPDLLFLLHRGLVLWVEAKITPRKPTAVQLLTQQKMVRAGAHVVVLSYAPERPNFYSLGQWGTTGLQWSSGHFLPNLTNPAAWCGFAERPVVTIS